VKKQTRSAILHSVVGLALVLCFNLRAVGQQQFHADSFEAEELGWTSLFLPRSEQSRTRVVQHRREKSDWNQTGSAEVLRLKTVERNQQMILSYSLPPARPFDELKLTLRLKSNQEGLRLGVRVVFADHLNPRTGKPLTAYIWGDVYRSGSKWKELTCAADRLGVDRAVRWLRERTNLPLNTTGLTYVDRAILMCDLNPGNSEVSIDDLNFGPIVSPNRLAAPKKDRAVKPWEAQDDTNVKSRVGMRLGQLQVDGKPFLPRMTAWHEGDSVAQLKQAGINTVWIEDATDTSLLQELEAAGMYAIAVPPAPPVQQPGTRLVNSSRTLLPTENSNLLFWYLGTRVTPGDQKKLISWSKWLKTTDPARRPLMADVTGAERLYSRHVNLLGLSRPVLGTSVSLRDYRNTLLQRRAMAQPGKFMWTWVQADVPGAQANRTGLPYVLEPEQLRLQTYAAIAAGSKAVGFWKTTPLNSTRPGDDERRLMMHQLNLELSLIEDWLATGQLAGSVTCEAGAQLRAQSGGTIAKQEMLNFLARKGQTSKSGTIKTGIQKTNVEATIINSNKGKLLLPVWYSDSAQFVPSELVAENLSLVVHVPHTQREAWLVTTTGIRRLSAPRQAGGVRIHLSTADQQTFFDQTAIILITSRQDILDELRLKVSAIAEDSAKTSIQLAQAKLNRIQTVEQQLAVPDNRTTSTFNRVYQILSAASVSVESTDYHSARRQAQQAMRLLRRLQHTRWKAATEPLSSPTSSPHAVSYQTLPDHYAMLEHIRSTQPTRVAQLLPAVSGNEPDSLENSGWRRFTGKSDTIRKEAQFTKGNRRYSLNMVASPIDRKQTPEVITEPPIRVTSPILQLTQGETVSVTGRVRIPTTISGNVNGAMLFDSIGGPAGSLRWRRQTNGWVPFDILREAETDTPFYLTFLLSGLGQMQVSDLEVVVYPGH
jgi:hypothetical protein